MTVEYYELGDGDSLAVIVNVTDEEDPCRVMKELSRLYSWDATRGPEVQIDEDTREATEWLTLTGVRQHLTVAQPEFEAA